MSYAHTEYTIGRYFNGPIQNDLTIACDEALSDYSYCYRLLLARI